MCGENAPISRIFQVIDSHHPKNPSLFIFQWKKNQGTLFFLLQPFGIPEINTTVAANPWDMDKFSSPDTIKAKTS